METFESAEEFKRRRARLSKIKRRLSEEEFERRYNKYHGKQIRCPICGKIGVLRFQRNGDRRHQYFYCIHSVNPSDACYIGRIEDIEELLNPPAEVKKKPLRQVTLLEV